VTEDRAPGRRSGPDPARSFGGEAAAYDRGRPTYPRKAVTWLVGDEGASRPLSVLELGAGTGKLTEQLVALGHDVHATDPDAAMLDVLAARLPDIRTTQAGAEELPVASAAYDVVVAAQCYHWFDTERALPEISRVLRPGGHLAVVWNERDERVPWVRKLGRVIGTQTHLRDPEPSLGASDLFSAVEQTELRHRQHVDRRTIVDLARSRSNVAVLDEPARERLLADLLALYDHYGRGMDGMELPYLTRCFRARALPRPAALAGADEAVAEETDVERTQPLALDPAWDWTVDTADRVPSILRSPRPAFGDLRLGAGEDDGVVLIDFR